jgi:AAA domain-containing protein
LSKGIPNSSGSASGPSAGARPSPTTGTQGPPPPRFQLLSIEEVSQLEDPEDLIEGLIERESFTLLFAPPESAKSFLALDLGLSIATGLPWQGRTVKKGPVVYVVAEGGRGIKKRIKAWLQEHGFNEKDDIHVFSC